MPSVNSIKGQAPKSLCDVPFAIVRLPHQLSVPLIQCSSRQPNAPGTAPKTARTRRNPVDIR